jgi:hypothetical protein
MIWWAQYFVWGGHDVVVGRGKATQCMLVVQATFR